MDKIIALVGESGSGKTTIAELLEKEGYRNINSFTTRKPRYEGETGHLFTNLKQYECNKANNMVVAETELYGDMYWTTKGQFYGTCIYVIDPAGIKDLKQRFKRDELVIICLKADREVRLERMLKERKLEVVQERMEKDKDIFKVIEADYVVDSNRPIKEVLEDVKSIIKRS